MLKFVVQAFFVLPEDHPKQNTHHQYESEIGRTGDEPDIRKPGCRLRRSCVDKRALLDNLCFGSRWLNSCLNGVEFDVKKLAVSTRALDG